MGGDLPGQVRPCLGEPVRPVRDPAHHRLSLLRAAAPGQRGGLVLGLGPRASMTLGLELVGGLLDSLPPPGAIPQGGRHPIRAVIAVPITRCGVLGPICLLGLGHHAGDVPVEPLLAPVGVDRGVGCDLGAVDGDRAEPSQPGSGGDHQDLREQVRERVLGIGAEPGDRGVVRAVLGAQHPERHVSETHPFDRPRGPHPLAVGVDQQSQQHSRVVAGSTGPATTPGAFQSRDVESLDGLQHEPDQVILRKPLSHVHRQQHRLIPEHRAIRLGHATSSLAHHRQTTPGQHPILQQAP